MTRSVLDSRRTAVYAERLAAICDEMGEVLRRSADSPNIKTRCDYSCAILLELMGKIDVGAQAAHIPVHLGSLDMSVEACLELALVPGEIAILNDPYRGGTHLPDVTLVANAAPSVWVAVRAHHADVGGCRPGSLGGAGSIEEEGCRIGPCRLTEGIIDRFCAASRAPGERRGDLLAQSAAVEIGLRAVSKLSKKVRVSEMLGLILENSSNAFRDALLDFPSGAFEHTSYVEGAVGADGARIPISVNVEKEKDRLVIDFAASGGADRGCRNAPLAVTRSAVLYLLQGLFLGPQWPANSAPWRHVNLAVPAGGILAAAAPSAVSAGNVETSQAVVEVLLAAMAKAMPGRTPAGSQATMNNLAIGGTNWAYYETIAGGMGASSRGPGADAIAVHMTNTRNTSAEEIETSFPLRVVRHQIRRGSGGHGRHRGGNGVTKVYEALAPCTVTFVASSRKVPPRGADGGGNGAPGADLVLRVTGEEGALDQFVELEEGDRIEISTPGGGGWGLA